jgi:hypothetical protein
LWRDLLGHVGYGAVGVELRAQEGGDGGFVCDAAGADGAVRKEAWDEVGCANDEGSLWGEEVEVRVVGAGICVLACEVSGYCFDVVLATSMFSGFVLQVFEDGGVKVVVITIAEIEVASNTVMSVRNKRKLCERRIRTESQRHHPL